MTNKINLKDIEKLIISITQKDITLDKNHSFQEIGLDSLDIYSLFLEIEKKTKKKVSDEQFDKIKNVNDLLIFFNA